MGSEFRLMLLLMMTALQVCGQEPRSGDMGDTVRFRVAHDPVTIVSWEVSRELGGETPAEPIQVDWLSEHVGSSIMLRWHEAGTFFMSATCLDSKGCTNRRVFPVRINVPHTPEACDDFVTGTWIETLRIRPLDNDHDPGNDLDSASLKVIREPANGRILAIAEGEVTYASNAGKAGTDQFVYCVCDKKQHCDTAVVTIDIQEPPLEMPQAISPNGDGINDKFVVAGLDAYPGSALTVFSRTGTPVYRSMDYRNDWPGNGDGRIPSMGTYYFVLQPGGSNRLIKGFLYLAR